MAISEFTENLDIIAALSDTPNDTLTAAELKAKFDLAGNKLKTYINGTLVPKVNELLGFLASSGGTTALDGSKIKSGTVGASQIASNAVITAKILDGNVTTAKIADSAVTSAKIANATITQADMANGSIGTNQIIDAAVTHAKIKASAVEADNIKNYTITGEKIASHTIDAAAKLDFGTITNGLIADGTIQAAKLAPGVVPTLHWQEVNAAAIVSFPTGCTMSNLISVFQSQDYANGPLVLCPTKTTTSPALTYVAVYYIDTDGKVKEYDSALAIPKGKITFVWAT